MFPKFPFFYRGNLGNSQIRQGQILTKVVARTNIETECFFHFSGFFVGLKKVLSEKWWTFFRNLKFHKEKRNIFATSDGKKIVLAQFFFHVWRKKDCASTIFFPSDVEKELCHSTIFLPSDVAYFVIFPYETTTKKKIWRLIELRRKSKNKWENYANSSTAF